MRAGFPSVQFRRYIDGEAVVQFLLLLAFHGTGHPSLGNTGRLRNWDAGFSNNFLLSAFLLGEEIDTFGSLGGFHTRGLWDVVLSRIPGLFTFQETSICGLQRALSSFLSKLNFVLKESTVIFSKARLPRFAYIFFEGDEVNESIPFERLFVCVVEINSACSLVRDLSISINHKDFMLNTVFIFVSSHSHRNILLAHDYDSKLRKSA